MTAVAVATDDSERFDVPDTVARPFPARRWASGALALAIAIAVGVSLWRSPAIDHSTVTKYFTASSILRGLRATVVLALLSMLIGTVLAIPIALMRLSANPVLRTLGWLYLWIFRGVPVLVQIVFWGNLALFYERIEIGIPFTDVTFKSWDTNDLITGFVASVLALALNEAAHMAEIVRAGVLSVPRGQSEAARALGLSRRETLRKVVFAQAVRLMVPPTGTQFINMLKMTSLVSVIAGGDLLTQAQNISATNLRTIELLIVASAWYLLVTSLASVGQSMLERRLGKAHRR